MARYRLQPCALMWGYFYRDHSHTARSPCVRAGKRPPLAYKASDYLRGHYQVRNLPRRYLPATPSMFAYGFPAVTACAARP